jgi:hypothetical protein
VPHSPETWNRRDKDESNSSEMMIKRPKTPFLSDFGSISELPSEAFGRHFSTSALVLGKVHQHSWFLPVEEQ